MTWPSSSLTSSQSSSSDRKGDCPHLGNVWWYVLAPVRCHRLVFFLSKNICVILHMHNVTNRYFGNEDVRRTVLILMTLLKTEMKTSFTTIYIRKEWEFHIILKSEWNTMNPIFVAHCEMKRVLIKSMQGKGCLLIESLTFYSSSSSSNLDSSSLPWGTTTPPNVAAIWARTCGGAFSR